GAGNITASGGILGANASTVTKSGTGTLTIAAASTYSGVTTLTGGKLRATSFLNALGTGALTLNTAGTELQLANSAGLAFANAATVTASMRITPDLLASGAGVTHSLGSLSLGNGATPLTLTLGAGSFVTSALGGLPS